MNEIERRFYEGFSTYVEAEPCFSVQDLQGLKIADCRVLPEESPAIGQIAIEFPTFPEILENQNLLIFLRPQEDIGPYRVDFLFFLEHMIGTQTRLAIEIDGHEWHVKNKAQAIADKKRDRFILSAGVPVVRFTGSEVYTSAASCVQEVLSCSVSLLYETIINHHEHYLREIAELRAAISGGKTA